MHCDRRGHDVILVGTEKVLLPKIDPPACRCLAFLGLGTMPESQLFPQILFPQAA